VYTRDVESNPSITDTRFDEGRLELRRRATQRWLAAAGIVPFSVIVVTLDACGVSTNWGLVPALIWMVGAVYTQSRLGAVRCPRCGVRFLGNTPAESWAVGNRLWPKACAGCRLPLDPQTDQ
jgi:hypothetical protein